MIKFKHEEDQNCFLFISPVLGAVMIDLHQWFSQCGYDFIITSVIRKLNDGSVSDSHAEGRAFDVRLKHIKKDNTFIKDTVASFNQKYSNIAAISSRSLKPNLIVAHGEGDNFHFHVQLNRSYKNIYAQNFFKEKKQ